MLWEESDIEKQIDACHAIIDRALEHHPAAWVPLLSGGHDSICACHAASLHPQAPRPFRVAHINTGIGAAYTRQYVADRCTQFGWELEIHQSAPEDSLEEFVRHQGLPGPGMHKWVYARIKERSIQRLATELSRGQRPVSFISGVRRSESLRRMGYAVAIRRGDGYYSDGLLRNPSRLWVAPCIEWQPANQTMHMEEFGIPRNAIKDLLGISGECFCGSNAREDQDSKPSERAIIDTHPLLADVKAEIERLEQIARDCGHPDKWGCKPDQTPPQEWEDTPLGMMDLCAGCQK